MDKVLTISVDKRNRTLTAIYQIEPGENDSVLDCNDALEKFKQAILYCKLQSDDKKPKRYRKRILDNKARK